MIVDGVEYVRAATGTAHVVVIATNGWIFEGFSPDPTADHIALTQASVVRKWANGRGIGALADPDHKDEYTRDPVGAITVHSVVAVIECRW